MYRFRGSSWWPGGPLFPHLVRSMRTLTTTGQQDHLFRSVQARSIGVSSRAKTRSVCLRVKKHEDSHSSTFLLFLIWLLQHVVLKPRSQPLREYQDVLAGFHFRLSPSVQSDRILSEKATAYTLI